MSFTNYIELVVSLIGVFSFIEKKFYRLKKISLLYNIQLVCMIYFFLRNNDLINIMYFLTTLLVKKQNLIF